MSKLLDDVKQIEIEARKLHLLAINARIETLKAESYFNNCSLAIKRSIVVQAKLLNMLIEKYGEDTSELNRILEESGCEEIYATNSDNVIIASIPTGLCGKTISATSIRDKLRKCDDYIELPKKKLNDGSTEITVAMERRDGKGIIQVGHKFKQSKGITTVMSFGVVADELNKLAESMEKNTDNVMTDLRKEEGQSISNEFRNNLNKMDKNARMSNLLAIRAKIESAQASNDTGVMDKVLAYHMEIHVKMIQKLIAYDIPDMKYMRYLTEYCGIDEIWGTDETGRVVYTNIEGGTEFSFKNEGQTAKFCAIFGKVNSVVAAPPQKRIWDNKIMKYVGIGNYIKGLVQIGSVADFKGDRASAGFANVAEEARKIANIVIELTEQVKEEIDKNRRINVSNRNKELSKAV